MFSVTKAEAAAIRSAFNKGGTEMRVIAPDTQRRDRWMRAAAMMLSAIVSVVVVASLGAMVVAARLR
jgi:hypothetical protein